MCDLEDVRSDQKAKEYLAATPVRSDQKPKEYLAATPVRTGVKSVRMNHVKFKVSTCSSSSPDKCCPQFLYFTIFHVISKAFV